MKKSISLFFLVVTFTGLLLLSSCQEKNVLAKPKNLSCTDEILTWYEVENASGYLIDIDSVEVSVETNSYSLETLREEKTYSIKVKAIGLSPYKDSSWSQIYSYNYARKNLTIAFPEEEHFQIVTEDNMNFKSGDSFSFRILLNPEYDKSSLRVRANGVSIYASSGIYNLKDIQENIIITIENIQMNSYQVSFNFNGGYLESGVAPAKVTHNNYLSEVIAAREDYIFSGWFSNSELTEAWDFAKMKVTKDMTLYAKWEPDLLIAAKKEAIAKLKTKYEAYLTLVSASVALNEKNSAENKINLLKSLEEIETELNNAFANLVINSSALALKIGNIGLVSYEKKPLFEEILSIYNWLSPTQKSSISNNELFLDSLKEYEEIELNVLKAEYRQFINETYDEKILNEYSQSKETLDELFEEAILGIDESSDKEVLSLVKDKFYQGVSSIKINSYEISFDLNYSGNTTSLAKTITHFEVLGETPKPVLAGFVFCGWYDGDVRIEEYTVLNKNVTLKALWKVDTETNCVNEAEEILKAYFKNIPLVERNLSLPTSEPISETLISWQSSNTKIISTKGMLARDYKKSYVTLTATITKGEAKKEVNFPLEVAGYKDLSKPLATGYIYTNYANQTDEYFDIMDIIFCAFALVDTQADLLSRAETKTTLGYIKAHLLNKAHERGDYLVLSVGGGGQSSQFGTIAASAELRVKFAKNVVDIINQNQLDGIDIDWETPTSAQAPSFTLLAEELFKQVKANNPNHLITVPITGGPYQPPRYDLKNSIQYIDFINMMTYGMTNNNMQYHNPLYKSSQGRTLNGCTIDESVTIFNNLGVPSTKLIAGMAFYGMSQVKEGGVFKAASGNISYVQIKNNISTGKYIEYYDEECEEPYLMNPEKTSFVSYDNPRSIIAKCQYVKTKGIAGVTYWQNGHDTTGELVRAIKDGYEKK